MEAFAMIINTRCPQIGGRKRQRGRTTGTIQQRVANTIEQSRRDRESACDHWFVRNGTSAAAPRVCTKCGATRSY